MFPFTLFSETEGRAKTRDRGKEGSARGERKASGGEREEGGGGAAHQESQQDQEDEEEAVEDDRQAGRAQHEGPDVKYVWDWGARACI